MDILLVAILAITVMAMLYYRLRMDFVLAQYNKLRLIPPRFGGESIKIFVAIIENEQDPTIQAKYISIYKGIKYSRLATLIALVIAFVALSVSGK